MKEKALELLNIFYDNGYEAYIVGGFVRDALLGRESYDIDICTNATPKDIKEIFKNVDLPHEEYGSVHLTYKKVNFEITTYRLDLEYKDKRKPSKIFYTNKLIIDLKRRDFTVNTICMDKDGNILDLLNAKEDLKNKVLRVVGDANKKLDDDALRILRAIRFSMELKFEMDESLKKAIINNRKGLERLSFDRKKQELQRIFSSKNSSLGISLLREFELDKYLGINLNKYIVITNDPLGIWAQINPSDKYTFTSNEKTYLKAILRVLEAGNINDIVLYKEGNYVCSIACNILKIDESVIHNRFESLPIKKQSDIKINGKDIIELLNPKDMKIIKTIINDIEEKIIYRKLNNEKEELIKYIIDTYQNNVI